VAAAIDPLTAAAGLASALASACALAASVPEYEAALVAMVRVNWSWNAAACAASA
jgi:hypothetical protein